MGGKNAGGMDPGSSAGRLGTSKADMALEDFEMENNYNQVVYPEFKKFLKEIEEVPPPQNPEQDKHKAMLAILKDASPETKKLFWELTTGQNLTLKDKNNKPLQDAEGKPILKYPELHASRFMSQKDVSDMSKKAVNMIDYNAQGNVEAALFKSYQELGDKIDAAQEILDIIDEAADGNVEEVFGSHKNVGDLIEAAIAKGVFGQGAGKRNYWIKEGIDKPEVKKDLALYAGLAKVKYSGEPGTVELILRHWLADVTKPNETITTADIKDEDGNTWYPFSAETKDEYEGFAYPSPLPGTTQPPDHVKWDKNTRRWILKQEKQDSEKAREIIVGEIKELNDLKKIFKDGDRVRFVKLGDEDEHGSSHPKQAMRIVHSLLFGDNPNSILVQAIEGAWKFRSPKFDKDKENIVNKLKDTSIVFNFEPPDNTQNSIIQNPVMQYSAEKNTIIVPLQTLTRMINALKLNDQTTIKEINDAAYHELTHAIHSAVNNEVSRESIEHEFVADGFSRFLLRTNEQDEIQLAGKAGNKLTYNSFEKTQESGYDPVIRELLQDQIFQDTIPPELMSIDPITREPKLKQVPPEQIENLIQKAVANRKEAIAKLNKTVIETANNLVKKSFFPDRMEAEDEIRLSDYIKKSIKAHELRKGKGGSKPVLEPGERAQLNQFLDDPFEEDIRDKTLKHLQDLLFGAKIPPSVISAMQIIGLSENGVRAPLDHLSRAKRALTKECQRLQAAMEQDTQDLETVLRILFEAKKPS